MTSTAATDQPPAVSEAAAATRNEILAKLHEAGINSLIDVNPLPARLPLSTEDKAQQQATTLPIDDLPPNFTDFDHLQRNRLLPAVPTRQQFLDGMVRGFNIYASAEFLEPALTQEELHYESTRSKRLKLLASAINRKEVAKKYEVKCHGIASAVSAAVTSPKTSLVKSSHFARTVAIFLVIHALSHFL